MEKTFAGKTINSIDKLTYELLQEEVRLRMNARAEEIFLAGGDLSQCVLESLLNASIESVIADVDELARKECK